MLEVTAATYKFEMNSYGRTKIILEGSAESISEILEDYKDFLRGCGFSSKCVDKITYDNSDLQDFNGLFDMYVEKEE